MDLVNIFKRIISLLILKKRNFTESELRFLILNRSGLILIPFGGFYINPGPSNPSSKGKFTQIWEAGADGLRAFLIECFKNFGTFVLFRIIELAHLKSGRPDPSADPWYAPHHASLPAHLLRQMHYKHLQVSMTKFF